MLWGLIILLLILWALGWGFAGIGSLVHLLLVIIVVLVILQLMGMRGGPPAV